MFLQCGVVLFLWAQPDDAVNFAAVFYQDHGGDAEDLEFLRSFGVRVHIKFRD
jgi:hypothetical protein